MSAEIHHEMIAHAHAGLPLEACGLFAGSVGTDEDATVARFYPTDVMVTGFDILFFWVARMIMAGVWFDGQAPDEAWHYVIVSMRDDIPSLRSYRIIGGEIHEEPVELIG